MANTYTTSSGVRLFDVRSSGTLLYPETSLPMVQMVTYGGVISSGSSLGLNASSAWVSGLSGIIAESYCPLSKVVSGNTQYADMYTTGGTATVTNIGVSTGYGTLLNTIEVTTSIRGTDAATNSLIPTERAVAMGLETKQETLSAGSGIDLAPDGRGTTTVAIRGALVINNITSASPELYPTESAVRQAIDIASEGAQTSAIGIITSQISSAGYATSNWCLNTFVQKGEPTPGPTPSDWSYATTDSAGVVRPIASGGLEVGAQGALNLMVAPIYSTHALASAGSRLYNGGVKVLNAMTGVAATYQLSAYVPNTYAVYSYTSANYVSKTDYAVKNSGSVAGKAGIVEPASGLSMTATSKLCVAPASTSVIGGVMVPSNKGLSINAAGSLSLAEAPLVPNYATAATSSAGGNFGGVLVMSSLAAAGTGQSSIPVVPTVDAVYNAVEAAKCPHTFSSGLTENGTTHVVTLDAATTAALGGIMVGSGLSANGTGKLSVTPATTTSLGGVFVPANKGLSIGNNGSITLARAPIVSTYEQVYEAERAVSSGGVILTDSMVYPTINPSVLTPSVKAIISAYGSNTQFAIYSSSVQNTVSRGSVYYISGNVYTSNAVYIGKLGPASLIVGSGSASRYAYAHIQSANNAWTATMASGTTVPNDSENNYYVPIASAEWGLDASNQQYVSSYQLHTGPIIIGKDTRTGGGAGQTTITKKTNNYGISLAGDAATGYTIGFDYASPLSANTANNQIGVSKATTDAFGVVKIKEGGGIGVTGGTIYTTSDTYQGPFKVTSTGAATKQEGGATITGYSVAVAGGLVYELDDAQAVGDGTAAIFPGDTLYLYGSSGATTAAYHTHADYAYTTNGASGWAGEMAIPIASNNAGAIVQLQYGHIQREHWGDDYREEFNISRIGPIDGMNYDPAAAAGATGSYLPYKFIVKNGGKVLGLPDTIPAADALLDSTYIAYPTVAVSGTNKTDALYLKVVNGGMSGGATYDDASRVPIWMNIWHGKWVTGIGGHNITRGGTTITPTTSAWRYVVDTRCYETANLTSITNAYSVQLGYVTMNGAPIQIQKGAIEVRGRWT